LPLQQHFMALVIYFTLKLYLYGQYSIQTMIWFIWFKNIEKMLLQMVFCNLSQLYLLQVAIYTSLFEYANQFI
jgi:hypothetical protein